MSAPIDTPETNTIAEHIHDAADKFAVGHDINWRFVVPLDMARNIERERNALREENARLKAALEVKLPN